MNKENKNEGIRWQVPVICISAIIIVGILCFRPTGEKRVTIEEPVVEETVAEVATPQEEVTATTTTPAETEAPAQPQQGRMLYGIDCSKYNNVYEDTVQGGQRLADLFLPYTSYGNVLTIAERCKDVYDLETKMQIDHKWVAFCNTNDQGESIADIFVYEINSEDILVINLNGGDVSVERRAK